MQDAVMMFRQLDLAAADLDDLLKGKGCHEDALFIPRPESRRELEKTVEDLIWRSEALPEDDPALAILKRQMAYFLEAKQAEAEALYTNPAGEIEQLSIFLEFLLMDDCRSADIRAELFCRRLAQAELYYRQGLAPLLGELSGKSLSAVINICRQIAQACDGWIAKLDRYLPGLTASQQEEVVTAINRFHGEMDLWIAQTQAHREAADTEAIPSPPADQREYGRQLMTLYGIELDALLSWCDEEVAKTRERVLSLGAALPVADPAPRSVKEANELLLKYAGPCSSPEEMFARGRECVRRAREVARQWTDLPEETCLVDEIKETLKSSYPWGGYRGGDPKRRPVVGAMFYNQYNHQAVTDGWIRLNAIHEGYPGHHVQFVKTTTDPLPEILKRGARHIALLEGTAHRSEDVFSFIFDEDPFFPLFVAYRRHHTAVRVKADLMLRYQGRPADEVAALYESAMGFDAPTARGQVLAQELMCGYFTNYYYGVKTLTSWEKELGFDQKAFTQLLFSAGYMSLDNLRRYLLLSQRDRCHLETDFASLRPAP